MIARTRLKEILGGWNSSIGTMVIRGLGLGINFGSLAVVARWSNQESLGIIIAMNGLAFVGGGIFSLGVPTLLLKTIPGYLLAEKHGLAFADYLRGMYYVLVASIIGVALSGLAAGGQIFGWLPDKMGSIGPVELVATALCSLGMAFQFVGLSAIRALKQPALSGLLQFGTPPFLLLGAFAFAHIMSIAISTTVAVSALCGSTLLNALLVHAVVKSLLPNDRAADLAPMPWGEARSFWLLGVMSSASANVLLLLAAIFLDPSQVALLGVPFRICNLPMTVVAALGAYYAPIIREAHLLKDSPRKKMELLQSQWLGALLVLPVLIAAIIAPGPILGLFRINDVLASRLFLLFACAQVLIAGCGVCEQYLAMVGKARTAAFITASSFVGMVVGVGLLIANFGVFSGSLMWAGIATIRQLLLRARCTRDYDPVT